MKFDADAPENYTRTPSGAGKQRAVVSRINIKRAVENIRSTTTPYTPVVEVIVNALQAIEDAQVWPGTVTITIHRQDQLSLDDSLADVSGFSVEDNGIGFNADNRSSFDTLFSDRKISTGGKGFGRFTCLKYFGTVKVESIFLDVDSTFKSRAFSMGTLNDIIVDEQVNDIEASHTGTVIHLADFKANNFDKRLTTIAGNLVERLLPNFITEGYVCPEITLVEADGTSRIVLNEWFSKTGASKVQEVPILGDAGAFSLDGSEGTEEFSVRVFKLYDPRNQKSKISFVANQREVPGSSLHYYVPEFIDEFCDSAEIEESDHGRNFIVKAYVFSAYLERHVSMERGGFEFSMDGDMFLRPGQREIEGLAALIAQAAMGDDVRSRQDRKRERVQRYVEDEAPWHRALLQSVDLSGMPFSPTDEEIEIRLQQAKFVQATQVQKEVSDVLAGGDLDALAEGVSEIVSKVSDNGRNDLIHYVATRRFILELFKKSLERDKASGYAAEAALHSIIFPMKGTTDDTPFFDHNLWIVDERLSFSEYLASDLPLKGGLSQRPDLIGFDRPVTFRGDNDASNPVTIFEFKKPGRDNFADRGSKEDPVDQIIRYVNDIIDGKYKTPKGRQINVSPNTPFYGYVVCDLNPKVENWLERLQDFRPMPDRRGWFKWIGGINLYIEVLDWSKVLRDAQIRNLAFFHRLGI